MTRKQNTKRLELESLEGRELPTTSLAPVPLVPVTPSLAPAVVQTQASVSQPKVLANATLPAGQPSIVQTPKVTELTKTLATAAPVAQPTAAGDAVWVTFSSKFAG